MCQDCDRSVVQAADFRRLEKDSSKPPSAIKPRPHITLFKILAPVSASPADEDALTSVAVATGEVITAGPAVTKVNVGAPVAEEVWPSTVAVTAYHPTGSVGVTAVQLTVDAQVPCVRWLGPKSKIVVPGVVEKPVPLTVTDIPPDDAPHEGDSCVTVGVGIEVVVVDVVAAHDGTVTRLLSKLTWPLRASTRPSTLDPVRRDADVKVRMLPTKVVSVPNVAELPTCQNTLHA